MITKETIDVVTKKLVEAYEPVEIYLFGSYAWGDPTEDSDLDLLVVVDKSEDKSYKRPVVGYFALQGMNISKDIIVFTKEEFLRKASDVTTLAYKIKQEGKVIYARA